MRPGGEGRGGEGREARGRRPSPAALRALRAPGSGLPQPGPPPKPAPAPLHPDMFLDVGNGTELLLLAVRRDLGDLSIAHRLWGMMRRRAPPWGWQPLCARAGTRVRDHARWRGPLGQRTARAGASPPSPNPHPVAGRSVYPRRAPRSSTFGRCCSASRRPTSVWPTCAAPSSWTQTGGRYRLLGLLARRIKCRCSGRKPAPTPGCTARLRGCRSQPVTKTKTEAARRLRALPPPFNRPDRQHS